MQWKRWWLKQSKAKFWEGNLEAFLLNFIYLFRVERTRYVKTAPPAPAPAPARKADGNSFFFFFVVKILDLFFDIARPNMLIASAPPPIISLQPLLSSFQIPFFSLFIYIISINSLSHFKFTTHFFKSLLSLFLHSFLIILL